MTGPTKPRTLTDIRHWADQGSCRPGSGYDPTLWHPESNLTARHPRVRKALTICHSCPVEQQCLAHAIEHEPYGIWGGTREQDRDHLRRTLGHQGWLRKRRSLEVTPT